MEKLHPSILAAMVRAAPRSLGRMILQALKKTHGNRGKAAKLLGVHHNQVARWIKKTFIEIQVKKLIADEKKKGTYDAGARGRPKLSAAEKKRRAAERAAIRLTSTPTSHQKPSKVLKQG